MIIVIIRGRRPKILLFSNNLRGISIAHTNEIYREDCCLEIVVEKIKEAAIPYFTSFAKQPFGFSFEFQMIWPMNREVFHSIFLGGLLLFFMFSEACVYITLTLSYRGQGNHYNHLEVKLTATIALFFLALPPVFKCR